LHRARAVAPRFYPTRTAGDRPPGDSPGEALPDSAAWTDNGRGGRDRPCRHRPGPPSLPVRPDFFAGISRSAHYNGGGRAPPSAGPGKASQPPLQPPHRPDRLLASGGRQDRAERPGPYGRATRPMHTCHRKGEVLKQLLPKTMPGFRAGHMSSVGRLFPVRATTCRTHSA
jgi:hypothetical protein